MTANQSSDSVSKQPTSTMNKVWLIIYQYYDETDVVGLYDSEDKANAALAGLPDYLKSSYIEPRELNKVTFQP